MPPRRGIPLTDKRQQKSQTDPPHDSDQGELEPWTLGPWRGWIDKDERPLLSSHLEDWLAHGEVRGGQEIKPGRVWRLDDWLIKCCEPPRRLRRWTGPARALSSARWHQRLAPELAPPVLFAAGRRRSGQVAESWLVHAFVQGQPLDLALGSSPATVRGLGHFMAQLARRRVLHGDLHPGNLLWDGARWVLIDLDGLRGGAQRVRGERTLASPWGRLLHNLKLADPTRIEPLKQAWEVTVSSLDPAQRRSLTWAAVERAAARHGWEPGVHDWNGA